MEEFRLGFSWRYMTLNVLAHGLLIAGSCLLPWGAALILSTLALAHGAWVYLQKISFVLPGATPVLSFRGKNWLIHTNNGEPFEVHCLPDSQSTSLWTVFKWRTPDAQRHGSLTIWSDALSDGQYRRLCRLMWAQQGEFLRQR